MSKNNIPYLFDLFVSPSMSFTWFIPRYTRFSSGCTERGGKAAFRSLKNQKGEENTKTQAKKGADLFEKKKKLRQQKELEAKGNWSNGGSNTGLFRYLQMQTKHSTTELQPLFACLLDLLDSNFLILIYTGTFCGI
jgi:hypothetical protein